MDPRILIPFVSKRERVAGLCREVGERCVRSLAGETWTVAAGMPRNVARGYLYAKLSGAVREQALLVYVRDPRIAAAADAKHVVAQALECAIVRAMASIPFTVRAA